jgi:hypothetical protein
MEGRTKLNEVAPNMIPAENPRSPSMIFTGTFLKKKTGMAPSPVANPAPRLASSPNKIGSIPKTKSIFESLFSSFERTLRFELVLVATSFSYTRRPHGLNSPRIALTEARRPKEWVSCEPHP